MIQKYEDKKKEHDGFKLRSLMLDFDEYLRIFVLPQIPAGFKDYRDEIRDCMDTAWHKMYFAALTTRRERQKHILEYKIEMAMVEVYLREIRDVCYRGKEGRKLDAQAVRRFDVLAQKHKEIMNIVWAWAKKENEKMESSKIEKVSGLVEKEEI